jgi:hypothetical protein
MPADQGPVELQEYEDRAIMRIKFACLLGQGPRLVTEANREYPGLFDGLPAGWSLTEEGWVEPIAEHRHSALRRSSADGDIVAVQYETGLELLLIGFALSQSADLVRSLWKEWRHRRETARRAGGTRGGDALSFEQTTRAPDGTATHQRVTVPAELVNDELIQRLIRGTPVESGRTG